MREGMWKGGVEELREGGREEGGEIKFCCMV